VDFAAADAEIVEFAVRKAAQLGNGFTVAAPVAEIAENIHFFLLSFSYGRGQTAWKLDRLARHLRNVATADAEVVELAVRKAAQLGNGVTVAAPVAVIADQVHLRARLRFVFFNRCLRGVDRLGRFYLEGLLVHGSNAFCALQH